MAWLWSLPLAMDGTEVMLDMSDTAESERMAVSMVRPKSGESMVLAMFSEPRLQEMSLPVSA
ncbi:hypothetical protein D3C85_1727810 [compost metagenome]